MVDCIDHILRRDHATAEEASVQATHSVLAALYTVKLDVDLTVVGVTGEADMDDLAVTVVALLTDVVLELLLPARLGLTVTLLAHRIEKVAQNGLLCLIVHVLE